VIVTGGKKVHPAGVENLLAQCPGIDGVGVAGRPDPVWGEIVTAIFAGALTSPQFLDWCHAHISGAFRPRAAIRVDALPVLANGKPDRLKLRQLVRRTIPSPAPSGNCSIPSLIGSGAATSAASQSPVARPCACVPPSAAASCAAAATPIAESTTEVTTTSNFAAAAFSARRSVAPKPPIRAGFSTSRLTVCMAKSFSAPISNRDSSTASAKGTVLCKRRSLSSEGLAKAPRRRQSANARRPRESDAHRRRSRRDWRRGEAADVSPRVRMPRGADAIRPRRRRRRP